MSSTTPSDLATWQTSFSSILYYAFVLKIPSRWPLESAESEMRMKREMLESIFTRTLSRSESDRLQSIREVLLYALPDMTLKLPPQRDRTNDATGQTEVSSLIYEV